jgi:hypothetical protein
MMTAALGQRRKGRGGGSPDFGTEVQYLMEHTAGVAALAPLRKNRRRLRTIKIHKTERRAITERHAHSVEFLYLKAFSERNNLQKHQKYQHNPP